MFFAYLPSKLPLTLLQINQSPDFHHLTDVLTEHTAYAKLYWMMGGLLEEVEAW